MSKKEALKALKKGKKIQHRFFMVGEYIFLNQNGNYQDDMNCEVSEKEFWKIRKTDEWEKD